MVVPTPLKPADHSQPVQTLLTMAPDDQLAPPLVVKRMRGLLAPISQQRSASMQAKPRMKRFVPGTAMLLQVKPPSVVLARVTDPWPLLALFQSGPPRA